MSNLWSDFKKFLMQGDLVAIAVAFILALAFKTVVDAFVYGVIMPIVAAVFGQPSFDDVTIDIGDGVIRIGTFINAVITFVIIGATLFVIVKTYERMKSLRTPAEKEEDPSEVELLVEIRDLLRTQRGA
jgi:large conductance mechanosensitive channel